MIIAGMFYSIFMIYNTLVNQFIILYLWWLLYGKYFAELRISKVKQKNKLIKYPVTEKTITDVSHPRVCNPGEANLRVSHVSQMLRDGPGFPGFIEMKAHGDLQIGIPQRRDSGLGE